MLDSFGGHDELTVLYDENCELCRRCRAWLESQPQLVPLAFAPAGSDAVRRWTDEWEQANGQPLLVVGSELVVVGSRGDVWVGPDAFIVCLWALSHYRSLAGRLSAPGMRGLARQVFHGVSAGRGVVSALLPKTSGSPDLDCDEGCAW